jgi:hypothetical protein
LPEQYLSPLTIPLVDMGPRCRSRSEPRVSVLYSSSNCTKLMAARHYYLRFKGMKSINLVRTVFLLIVCNLWVGLAYGQDNLADVVIRNLDNVNKSELPITFGHAFGVGEVPDSSALAARLDSGNAVPLQIDVKATHGDGSLRHAVLTAVLPELLSGGTRSIGLTSSTNPLQGTPVDLDSLLSTEFDATVNADIGGTNYSASARNLLQSAPSDIWLEGPLVSEWIVSGPLTTAGGEEHPHLTAHFHVRAYAGMRSARVSVAVENTWSRVANPRNFTYDASVTVQGQGTVLSQSNVNHYRQARWRRVFWWGENPSVHIQHDSEHMQRIAVVPTYDSRLSVPEYALAEMGSQWSGARTRLMGSGLIYSYMPEGGGRPDIAPLPRWTVRYLMTQDNRAKIAMMGTAEQAGSFGIHYRDRDTNLPISLDTYPNMTILGNGGIFPSCGGNCGTPYTPDVAHQPSMSFVPYLISGDYFHLEELQFWANWNMFYWGNHGGSLGLMVNDQIRAQAWGLRTLGHAAYITPDDHPLKAYFLQKLGNNLNWYEQNVVMNPPTPLGYLLNPSDLGLNNTFATWMDDFLTWSVGHLANLGFSNAVPIFEYKAQFPVGRMTDPGYCWILASTYWTRSRDADTGEAFQTWSDYKTAVIRSWDSSSVGPSFGYGPEAFPPNMSGSQEDALIAAECNSPEMASILGLRQGDMIGISWSHEGYPANLQPAVAMVAERDVPNGGLAWSVFDSRTVVPDSPPYDYNESPQWAVVPNSAGSGSPPPAPALPVVSLSANPGSITSGETTRLDWSSSNADSCTASGGWSGSRPLSGNETTGPLSTTTTFTLTCRNASGSASASETVSVATPEPVPTVTLTAQPATVDENGSATLEWSATNADSCTASGGWSGSRPSNGNETIGPISSTTTFTLTCRNTSGSASASEIVSVATSEPVPTVTLTAQRATINENDTTTLEWTAENADSCTASGDWSGSKPVSGSEVVGPLLRSSSFTLTCSGAGGSGVDSVSIVVQTDQPESRPDGGSGGSGSMAPWFLFALLFGPAIRVLRRLYRAGRRGSVGSRNGLTAMLAAVAVVGCSSGDGTSEESGDGSPNPGGGGSSPTVSLSATPESVDSGGESTLSWESTNADSCSASGAWSGSKATSGEEVVGPLDADSSFTLTCQGAGGTAEQSVTVSVPAAGSPPTLTLTADPASILPGTSSTLSWSSTNADSCSASGAWSGSKATLGEEVVGPLDVDSQFTLTCEGAGGTAEQSVTVTVSAVASPPTLTLTADPASVLAGSSSTLSWSSTNADSCTASGAWMGGKPTSGTESTGALTANSSFTLRCTGAGGSVSRTVSVSVSQGTGAAIRGSVDSSLIDRFGDTRVYLYQGAVTPDDFDGDGNDPLLSVPVSQDAGACTFSYDTGDLSEGEYTIALVPDAGADSPQQDDTVGFYGTGTVTVQSNGAALDFQPANVVRVGPGRALQTVAEAADVAQDGDVVEIDAGLYPGDVAVWYQDNLTLRGVGGYAHLRADGQYVQGKGIWVIAGNDVVVENIEFSEVTVPDQNGAGIRADGFNLTVCNGYFHDSEEGILGGAGNVLVEYSEFDNNGYGDGFSHNMYILDADVFTIRYTYTHHARIGHNIKTRARENYVLYNRIMDEADGTASYAVDIPNGGLSFLIGNLIQQGPNTDNFALVNYGTEGLSGGRTHEFYVINNTMVDDRGGGVFIQAAGGTSLIQVQNNILVGNGSIVSGSSGTYTTNLQTNSPGLVDIANYDYRITATSPARDAGTPAGSVGGFDLTPRFHYVHRQTREERPDDGSIDIGAYEYSQ